MIGCGECFERLRAAAAVYLDGINDG